MAIATNSNMPLVNQGAAVIYTWIKNVTVTGNDTTADNPGINILSQATLYLTVTAASGTSPTLDIYLQKKLADGSTYQDIAHFAQVTTSPTNRVMHMITGGNKEEAQQTNTLAASTVNSVPFGAIWIISARVGGTSPSFTFSLYMEGLT
jgi:hypothetical protein